MLNSGALQTRLKGKMLSLVAPFYDDSALIDDERLTGYTFDEYLNRLCQAIAEAMVEEIQLSGEAYGVNTAGLGDDHLLRLR